MQKSYEQFRQNFFIIAYMQNQQKESYNFEFPSFGNIKFCSPIY